MDAPTLTPAQLERMREIGLRLDRAGRLWQGDEPVTHPRLHAAILGWLDVLPDGRDVVRLDARRYAYVTVEDAHLRARGARWDGDRAFVVWDDGAEEELAYGALVVGPDGALQAPARGGRLRGRIAGAAYQTVTERLAEEAGGFVLRAAGRSWPLASA
ncbi:MAG: hypothetical protein R2939_04085 [Kofleriaceae bacterium]